VSGAWHGAPSDRSDLTFTIVEHDTDADQIPDWWEVLHGLDPGNSSDVGEDPDGDGLDNAGEYDHDTDPHDADTDGDGHTDGAEVAATSDPNDPASTPAPPPGDGSCAPGARRASGLAVLLLAGASLLATLRYREVQSSASQGRGVTHVLGR
jgi:hypothetical protein